MFSVFYFYLSANQSAVHKLCRMLCSESWAKQAHCYKEIKEDLRRLCNHLNVFVLNIISGLVAEICLQQAELLRTSTLHAIPADIFFWLLPTSKRPCRCQLDCGSAGTGWVCVRAFLCVRGRFGLSPSPRHICVDKHIFTHLFLWMLWQLEEEGVGSPQKGRYGCCSLIHSTL